MDGQKKDVGKADKLVLDVARHRSKQLVDQIQ